MGPNQIITAGLSGARSDCHSQVANARGVIVRWKPYAVSNGASPAAVKALSNAGGISFRYARPMSSGYYVYEAPGKLGNNAPALLAKLQSIPGVASVEPDLWVTADALIPRATQFSQAGDAAPRL